MKIFEVIGPHENKELELMLNNSKPAALINDLKIKKFKPYIKNKQLSLAATIPSRDNNFYSYVITVPGEEWRGKEIKNAVLSLRSIVPMGKDPILSIPYHKKLGELLGYSSDDIEHFITRNITSNIKGSDPT